MEYVGNLIKYTIDLQNVSADVRKSLYDVYDPVSYTGVSVNRDFSVISFFLTENERLEDYAVIPSECQITTEGTPPKT